MSTSWPWPQLIVALGLFVACAGCSQDLDVRDRTFYCEEQADCLEGFRCEPISSERSVCMSEAGADATVDATLDASPDVEPDVEPDVQQQDTAAPPDGGDAGGDVGIDCAPPSTACSGRCVDFSSDPLNCGVCGARCETGKVCANSMCQDANCPSPKIQAQVDGTNDQATGDTISLTDIPVGVTIRLDAAQSEPAVGNITDYQWYKVSAPANSQSELVVPQPQKANFDIDEAGEYLLGLRVIDESGRENCRGAELIITAISSN